MKLKTCQWCKKRIGINDYYCPYCKKSTNTKHSDNYKLIKELENNNNINYCGQCGTELSKHAKYCHKCGNEIYDEVLEKREIKYCPNCDRNITEEDAIYCSNCRFNLITKEESITSYEMIFNTFVNIPLLLILAYLIMFIIGIIPDFILRLKVAVALIVLLTVCYLIAFVILLVGKIKLPHNHAIRKKFKLNALIIAFFLPISFLIIEFWGRVIWFFVS